MLVNAEAKKVAVQTSTEKAANSIPFSQDKNKQNYAVSIRIPAVQTVIRKLLPKMGDDDAITFKGEFFADEKVIIYDLTKAEPVKRRAGRKKKEAEADVNTQEE